MDEFDLIHSITPHTHYHPSVNVGIGDDGAVYTASSHMQQIVCLDTMVEDVHFKTEYSSPQDIGYKALAVNISDVAAMGGIPKFYLVSLAVPSCWQKADVQAMYEGMAELAKLYRMDLIGGDTVSAPGQAVITLTVIGEVEKDRACLRSSARPGDVVFVTGDIGSSAAGLSLLLGETPPSAFHTSDYFIQKHKRPVPRVQVGRLCSQLQRAALNDISDGLASELHEIAESSSVTIEIEEQLLPVHPDLPEADPQWEKWVLFGGEDFELVGTVSQQEWTSLLDYCTQSGIPIAKIGAVSERKEASVLMTANDQRQIVLEKKGYNHFK